MITRTPGHPCNQRHRAVSRHTFLALAVVAVLAVFAAPAYAGFSVTDEHTGQTLPTQPYDWSNPYPCTAPCALSFNPVPACYPEYMYWGVFDANGGVLFATTSKTKWRYELPIPGIYSVRENESGGGCSSGGTFVLRVIDKTPPAQTVGGSGRQSIRRAHVSVEYRQDELGSVTVSGVVTVPGKAKKRSYKLVGQTVKILGTGDTKLSLRIPRKAVAAAKRALAAHRGVYATVTITGADSYGNLSSATKRIRLIK